MQNSTPTTSDLVKFEDAGPDAYDPGYSGKPLVQTCIAMMVLTTVAVAARFVSRMVAPTKHRRCWWDDWFALMSWAFLVALIAVTIDATHYGLGRHVNTLTWGTWFKYETRLWLLSPIYLATLNLAKISVLMFCIRVFTTKRPWFRWSVWSLVVFLVAYTITFAFVELFQCVPLKSIWSFTNPTYCIPFRVDFYFSNVPNIVVDVVILILPMPLIYRLNTSAGRRFGIATVYVAGYMTLALSVARIVVSLTGTKDFDATLWNMQPVILLVVEPSVCLIGACLPAHISLVRWIRSRINPASSPHNPVDQSNRMSQRLAFEESDPIRLSRTKSMKARLRRDDVESVNSIELTETESSAGHV